MHTYFFKCILLFLFASFFSNAQEVSSQRFTYLNQVADISTHQNKEFKLSADIRKDRFNGNELTYMSISMSQGTGDKDDILSSDTTYKKIVTEEWQTFSIEGKINPKAKKMVIALICMNNGKFFYDNFKLEVLNANGEWEELALINPDFEENTENTAPIWGNDSSEPSKNYTMTIVEDSLRAKNYCLMIEGKNVYGQSDYNGGFVAVNGVKLYYEIYGKGKPLLLLHGAGQSIAAFTSQIDFFSKHYKVIALDSRGRGRSTDNEDELTYVNQAKDVKEFLDALQLDSLDIVGWSDGGIIGLLVAMKYPEKVNKLVAMAANIHPDGLFPERLEMHKKTLEKLGVDEESKKTMRYKITKQLINYPQLQFEDLTNIKSPTLIMAGDHDVITDLHTVKIFQSIPNANLAIFPGETHWFPETNPKLFNTTVFDFLQKEFRKPRRY